MGVEIHTLCPSNLVETKSDIGVMKRFADQIAAFGGHMSVLCSPSAAL